MRGEFIWTVWQTLKRFNILTLYSIINNSADDHSNKSVSKSDPKSDQIVATHNSYGRKRKSLIVALPKEIFHTNYWRTEKFQGSSQPSSRRLTQKPWMGFLTSGRDFHVVRVIFHKEIFTGATHSAAGVLNNPLVGNWKDVGGSISQDRNTIGMPPRAITPVRIGTGPSVPQSSIGSQNIEGQRRIIIPQEVSNFEPLDDSIIRVPS